MSGRDAPPPVPALPPEQRIGAYEVLFELAHGGMGAVYLARASGGRVGAAGFERLVAVKRLRLHLAAEAESVQRFLDEANVAARIHHANVVSVHQVGSDEAGHFLVQDYVEGDTLQGLVDRAALKRKRLPPPIVLRIALDALAGLHAVHEAQDAAGRPLGALHRDVSTHNLLVGLDGVTRVADFGIARHALRSVVTDGQYLQGRVICMPPEYLARRPVDRRLDVYGMGVTLWMALAGDEPWPGASDAQIVHLATTAGLPPLSASGLTVAPAIEAIVAKACARDPGDRFESARAMLEAIEDLGRHTGWIASHREVAALVEDLAGRELTRRRAAVAKAQAATPDPSVTPAGIVVPDLARPRRGRVALAAAAAALMIAGAVLVAVRMGARPADGAPASTAKPAPSAAAPGPPASVAATPEVPDGGPAPEASTAAPPPAAPRPAAVVRPLPSHHADGRATSSPAPPPAGTRDAPAPTGITTANPYR
jgi:serine/threonine-protein kinase